MKAPSLIARWLRPLIGKGSTLFGSDYYADMVRGAFGGGMAKSGASVSVQSSLHVATVLACTRVIAEGLAQVPLKLYQANDRSREPATEHPLYAVLHRRPNEWGTSYELRETMAMHAVLAGNAFAFINRAGGQVRELLPIEPGLVTVKRAADLTLSYKVRNAEGAEREFPAESIWHLRGPSWNGYLGLETVSLAREAIGLAMASEETQASMHARGLRPSGAWSVTGVLNDQQYKSLATWLQENYASSSNAGKPMVMDRDAKWTSFAMSSVDAQHLETRRHQVMEICSAMRVLPIMIGFGDKLATFASAEQMFLAHVVHTLGPWFERIEQSIDCCLLTEADRAQGYYAKHVVAGLLRGAMKDTAEYLHKLVQDGVMTRNEARGLLEFNPLNGLDEPLTPANMTVGAEPAAAAAD